MDAVQSTYGLLGFPLGHSLSPVIHNTAFRLLDLEAQYILFSLEKEKVEGFFKELKQANSPIFGLNVTVPYKEVVIPYLDTLDPLATKVGAVNTIVVGKNRSLTGFNTDGPGFLAHLTDEKFDPAGKRVAILGAGGAARAVVAVFCLLAERPASIRIYDVDKGKASALVDDLGKRMDTSLVEVVSTIDNLNIELADLLINATPIGMKASDPCLVSEELLHPHLMVYDLVYNPAQTALLKLAASKGARAVNGLKMLFYQGVLAFQRWAEIQLPDDIKAEMWKKLYEACYKKF
jgi:shikimate dehydrogenase